MGNNSSRTASIPTPVSLTSGSSGELWDIPRQDLPYIRESDARELMERATAIALDYGYRIKGDDEAKGNGKERPKHEHSKPKTFFQRTNAHALEFIEPWAKVLFPKARYQKATGAWRVSSKNLGRNLEENISIHPDGIWDYGTERPYTAIDLVREYRAIKEVVGRRLAMRADGDQAGGVRLRRAKARAKVEAE